MAEINPEGIGIVQQCEREVQIQEATDCSSPSPIDQAIGAKYPSVALNVAYLESEKSNISEKKIHLAEGVKFSDDIKIDLIKSVDLRIMCRFLGASNVNEVDSHPYKEVPLISFLVMECILRFMEGEGYNFVGELNFDAQGNLIPPEKHVWKLNNKEISFTIQGFLYFEKINSKNNENVVFFLFTDLGAETTSITCYTKINNESENKIDKLESFAKQNNCLRGKKIKNVNMLDGQFTEVINKKEYTWDNYYFPNNIKELFELEVFGFLKNTDKYNSYGITKRGVLTWGKPGTGKTTLGYIICNNIPDYTLIWITSDLILENNHKAVSSIKLLYKLADFVSPSILFLEDLDLFSQDRSISGEKLRLGTLMNILDGVNSIHNCITIGTTNRLESIEEALKNRPGRFDRVIHIPELDKKLRKKMFINRLKDCSVSKKIIDRMVENTEEWTGAECQEFINTLHLEFINRDIKDKKITFTLANKVFEIMKEFGIGKISSNFGFSKKEKKE